MLTCAVALNRLDCKVLENPLLMERAMISAATPAVTPTIEITVMTEITVCLRLARR